MESGITYKKLQRYDAAEEAYHKAIELDPEYAAAYSNFGILLRTQKRYDEAEKAFQKAIELNENFNSYLAIASISKQLNKDFPPDYIDKAHQLMPVDDWYNRACLESVTGDFELAFENLKRAAKRDRFNPAWAWEDPDLQWIRDNSRFTEIVGPKPD